MSNESATHSSRQWDSPRRSLTEQITVVMACDISSENSQRLSYSITLKPRAIVCHMRKFLYCSVNAADQIMDQQGH